MKYDYQYKITFRLNEPIDIEYIREISRRYPNSKILVEVQNTKGISSSMIKQLDPSIAIRIAGGYDSDRINRYGKDLNWSSNYYEDAVIYTRNETIKILEEIEKIESGISKNWSDIQILLYVYDKLKRKIMYDPKFEHKLSSEIRSLRGLITNQTVCAGYAMILKEFMDRNNISCEYVEGYTKVDTDGLSTGAHAWNIININGRKYPIDLTWDNTIFRAGKSNSFDWLSKDIATFSSCHHPAPGEKTQNYEHTLSQIDPKLVQQIFSSIGIKRARDFNSTTYYRERKDGSKYILAQIGDTIIDNVPYYRYYYAEVSKNGKRQLPLILYSDVNVAHLVDSKNFDKPIPENYEDAVDNILFSKENIADSINKRTFYIGKVRKSKDGSKLELVSSYREISKPEEIRNIFIYPTKRFIRSDGSVFIAQQMFSTPHKANGIDVMKYDIYEIVQEDGIEVLKGNSVFTEKKFFNDNRLVLVDNYLSRKRLDRKVFEAGGYIGYIDKNGIITYNPKLVDFFKTSKKVDMGEQQTQTTQLSSMRIPSFDELKSLVAKYEIFIDPNELFDLDPSKIKIRDIKTGIVQTDPMIIDTAMFANIWLNSAGVKRFHDEKIFGERYAFNKSAEQLYNTLCRELISSCKLNGVIDPLSLLNKINNNSYKYNRDIVTNLFMSRFQTELINKIFLNSLGISEQSKKPKPLYTLGYDNGPEFSDGSTEFKR